MNKSIDLVVKVGVCIQKNGQLLLIRELHGKSGKYYWNIVKGTFDPDRDKDLFATAKREALEEAQAKIRLKKFLGVMYLREGRKMIFQFNFVVDLLGSRFAIPRWKTIHTSQRKKNVEHIVDARLFSKKELRKLTRSDFIGQRAYLAVQKWISGDHFDLRVIQKVLPTII